MVGRQKPLKGVVHNRAFIKPYKGILVGMWDLSDFKKIICVLQFIMLRLQED